MEADQVYRRMRERTHERSEVSQDIRYIARSMSGLPDF